MNYSPKRPNAQRRADELNRNILSLDERNLRSEESRDLRVIRRDLEVIESVLYTLDVFDLRFSHVPAIMSAREACHVACDSFKVEALGRREGIYRAQRERGTVEE